MLLWSISSYYFIVAFFFFCFVITAGVFEILVSLIMIEINHRMELTIGNTKLKRNKSFSFINYIIKSHVFF